MSTRVSTILDRKGGDVATIAPDATLADAATALAEHGIGALVVSSDGHRIQGILSERDIVRQLARAGADCLQERIETAMTAEVTTCSRATTADELMDTMTSSRIRHVPVVEDDDLVGIVSIGDVVKSRILELETETSSLQEYVTGSSY